MRKGVIRIILGLLLIILQALSVFGNYQNGIISFPQPVSSGQLLFDLTFYLSYYSVGIVGMVLLASGLFAFFSINHVPLKGRKTDAIKQRFCKYCGSPIDLATKKCTGCGKQYFRLPAVKKKGIVSKVIVVLSLLIVGLFAYRNIQYRDQISQLTAQLTEQSETIKTMQSDLESARSELDIAKSDVSEIKDKYRKKFSEAYSLSEENKEMKPIYDYCKKNLVFVTTDYGLYHKAGCFVCKFDSFSIEAYTVAVAKQKGYDPCWVCCN